MNFLDEWTSKGRGGEGGGEGGDGGGGVKIRKTRELKYEHNSFLIKNFILGDIFFSL